MEITIKNMVCPRCISSVEKIFEGNQIALDQVILGKVITKSTLSDSAIAVVKGQLKDEGFEWIDDYKTSLIEKAKNLIIEAIHHANLPEESWSDYLTNQIPYDYRYLSHLFSEIHGITLEQYILKQKIEKVKELIHYDQLTLTQIAYQLKYSSVAHLSAQFKKITGMTPTQFKSGHQSRQSIDLI